MKKIFAVFAVLATVVVLAACQNTKVDDAIAKNLPRICAVGASIHTAFVTVAATGSVKADVVRKEKAAYAALSRVCADPGAVNSSTALVVAAEAYAALLAAYKEAE